MPPSLDENTTTSLEQPLNDLSIKVKPRVKGGISTEFLKHLPPHSRARLERHGVDLSRGYPERPTDIPFYLDEAVAVRADEQEYIPRGKNADPEKRALLKNATAVNNLSKHIGTEIVGVQLADLNEQQLDELALLIAERTVVFFRDQDLPPAKQLEIGQFWGSQIEKHPQVPHVPGYPGITVLWPDHQILEGRKANFKQPGGASGWHTDLVHEAQPAGLTHLHNDQIPSVGGDTAWSSGYGAYDKLSPAFQEFLNGKTAIYRSAHTYIDRNDPLAGPKHIEREHPLVRTHPVTGWKTLWVNRAMTVRIVGLEPKESDAILSYLYDVYEKNQDIQVRFRWQPTKEGLGTSAIWDNRISQHNAIWDYEGKEPRHGTRVTSLGEVPHFDPTSPSRREALHLGE
ncbi:hypothetical protein LXG23DRAFT_55687 [Yarrowia lipolytica]|jgi:alpha-ketoglutarate-dependent taurine dioxygenase|uniref:TauD/TfdA-like domain-containing protein n=1 Tax=Yarrowia lipolytica TaxID=4952 RepID=A0A1D8NFI6_YARLL|nr:hypothetical protein YALI1_D26671g [Yarrowia lipolytica]KAB8285778.1 hypothetical protein BKA91DRAFT_106902 [Yarrowia lipolytica]KAE8171879.1 hypothetical protein BKA90DRAFT_113236 [Yarrowia lipolytica]KAJ8054119.1 hypothetical protein LXG23DRAFT_55687 [Yarrowia lipolytica]RMI99412.1 hypothetical protein BD777DRAFT_157561 [Yarrowia lipolytica]